MTLARLETELAGRFIQGVLSVARSKVRLFLRRSTVGAANSGTPYWLREGRTYPAYRLLPLADPKVNPRRVTKYAYPAYVRDASTLYAMWLKRTRYTIAETHKKFATVTLENGNTHNLHLLCST